MRIKNSLHQLARKNLENQEELVMISAPLLIPEPLVVLRSFQQAVEECFAWLL